MKIKDRRFIPRHYQDNVAVNELKKEMLKYSTDRISSAASGVSYVAWLFRNVLGEIEIAEVLEKELQTFLDCDNNPLKIADIKSVLLYAVIKLGEAGYPGCAIVLDNHTVKHFGELDELRITSLEEKKALETEQTKRFIDTAEKEAWASEEKPLIVVP